jgi:prepilin peptidase CpaA
VNLIAAAPIWLVLILIAAVVAAAVEDAVRLRISNLTSAVVALTALGAMLATGPSLGLWQNFAMLLIVLILGTIAFSAGIFGGGDVKLIAAVGLWLDLRGGLALISTIFVAGGIVALVYIASRPFRSGDARSKKDRRIPYGLAIALGTLITVAMARYHPAPQHYTLPPHHA